MPELPEVETTKRGLEPYLINNMIEKVIMRRATLRWPIPANLAELLTNHNILALSRRGKYLIFSFNHGSLIIHLGMSGRLCILTNPTPPQKHDHVDIVLQNHMILRYTDPRRFGAILWTEHNPEEYPLIKTLGIEPLSDDLTVAYLLKKSANRHVNIKPFIMDGKIIVGVGNIYASEALFLAKIHPKMPAGLLSAAQAERLIQAIRNVLNAAIQQGGTTLKDFVNGEGKPGYFAQRLKVYGRQDMPCVVCHTPLQSCTLSQRTTFFCPQCQSM